jgi:hypothetical protein
VEQTLAMRCSVFALVVLCLLGSVVSKDTSGVDNANCKKKLTSNQVRDASIHFLP